MITLFGRLAPPKEDSDSLQSPKSVKSAFEDEKDNLKHPTLWQRVFYGFHQYPQHPDPSKRSKKDSMMIIAIRAFLVLAIVAIIVVPSATAARKKRTVRREAKGPNASFDGVCKEGVCKWLGVRYAAPPTGNLRFARPQKVTLSSGKIEALKSGPVCPQDGNAATQDEDCLYLDIYAPAKIDKNVQVPVLIFFHGGGFQSGDSSAIDPIEMIQEGSKAKLPTVVVSVNYRLGLLGFLASTEMYQRQQKNANDVSLNNGFHDMSMAVQWARDNIGTFGGDPNQITIWGQSAGSFGSSAQLLKYQSNPPFQAAILESGSPGGVPVDPVSVHDTQYARVLQMASCDTAKDHIACLRGVDWKTLRSASIAEINLMSSLTTIPRGYYPWTPAQDGGPAQGGFYSSKPSDAINARTYAPVPILHGDCLDEGTYFVTHESNNDDTTSAYIKQLYFSGTNADNLVSQVLRAYPDDPTVGSPYEPVKAAKTDRFFGATNQYKRLASIYGDIRYQANRRFFVTSVANRKSSPVYSYIFSQYTPGTDKSVGVPHGSDLPYVTLDQDKNPYHATMALQWLAFAAKHDPAAGPGLPKWPQYTADEKKLMTYSGGKTSITTDDFRQDAIALLNSPEVLSSTAR